MSALATRFRRKKLGASPSYLYVGYDFGREGGDRSAICVITRFADGPVRVVASATIPSRLMPFDGPEAIEREKDRLWAQLMETHSALKLKRHQIMVIESSAAPILRRPRSRCNIVFDECVEDTEPRIKLGDLTLPMFKAIKCSSPQSIDAFLHSLLAAPCQITLVPDDMEVKVEELPKKEGSTAAALRVTIQRKPEEPAQ